MSSHCIYVNCIECGKTESVYTGDIITNDFDNGDWEGESICATCIECKEKSSGQEMKEKVSNYDTTK